MPILLESRHIKLGAVGKALVRDLLKQGVYEKVVTVGRKEVKLDDNVPKDKLVQKIVDFENLEDYRAVFRGVDVVFSCLGTTLAQAGGAAPFVKIDHDYVVNSAKIIAEENPAKTQDELSPVHYLYCSAQGANKNAFFLYYQTKGNTESDLADVGFSRVSIFRSALLEIEEERPQLRLLETIGRMVVSTLGITFLSAPVATVGRAMINASLNKWRGLQINQEKNAKGTKVENFNNAQILQLGKE
ncbi:hypothetical protein BC938DRAFT_479563 [Jimgerdemannia flammicorona]|uniref:NAD(P)-binding domain-containing protein n=1 Tax=Jimgerdemannia flammicorona TaxID=994334 RepID=A0A433QKK0_9FUNG|nr:hypothetical protein BC938DRAFT_479563 [Jimgerdemannia flammicorona]